jgi:hypothetical protein
VQSPENTSKGRAEAQAESSGNPASKSPFGDPANRMAARSAHRNESSRDLERP